MPKNYALDTVKTAARGHWQTILVQLGGIPAGHLDGQHHPCPLCDGTDRFNVDRNKFAETGSCHCNQCGVSGDGFHVLQTVNGWDFATALRKVGDLLVCDAISKPQTPRRTKAPKKPLKIYGNMPDAIGAAVWAIKQRLPDNVTIDDQPNQQWRYHKPDRTIAGIVLRFNRSDGQKEIIPVRDDSDGWCLQQMPEPRPLYRLTRIVDGETVYVCEGEPAADAIVSFELEATTNAGGSKAVAKTDWSPMEGKRVIIVPDNDTPGREFIGKVSRLIQDQAPGTEILVADLRDTWPDIPEKGDAADWSEHFDAKPVEWFRDELERIAKPIEFDPDDSDGKSNAIAANEFQPLQLSMLPEAFASIVGAAAPALGVDPAFLLMPILAVCAAAIGHSRSLMIKRGWFSPCILWTAVVGESGSGKSPAFRVAVQPLKDIQREHSRRHAAERAQYDADLREWKRLHKLWEKTGEGEEPQRPFMPTHCQVMTSDCTVEGLAPVLCENDRGIILARDELSHWLTSFDKYSGKGATSSNVTNWLEFYNAEFSIINRKSIEQRVLTIDRPSVSVTGGIQPGILARCLTAEHKDNGLASRLMLAYPPRQPKRWREEELAQPVVDAYTDLIRDLFELKPDLDSEGNAKPCLLRLNKDARKLMAEFVDAHGAEQNALQGHTASQWSKLEEIPARLAIVIHCVRQVTSGVDDPFSVDGHTMAAAINLAEWLKTEALRINRLLTEDEEIRNARHLANWIATNHAGRITAAKLRDYRRDIETTQQAEMLLISLVGLGFGHWQDIHKSREFVLQSA